MKLHLQKKKKYFIRLDSFPNLGRGAGSGSRHSLRAPLLDETHIKFYAETELYFSLLV